MTAQIEFPQALVKHDDNNGWEACCKKEIDISSNAFIKAVASTYHADIVDADQLLAGQIDPSIFASVETKIIHCKWMKNQIEELLRFVAICKLNKENIIVFFREVPCNFTSRELFEKTGIRSLALYATGN